MGSRVPIIWQKPSPSMKYRVSVKPHDTFNNSRSMSVNARICRPTLYGST